MMRREDIPYLLEAEGCRRGAELGVLNGEFALHTLDRWPSCVEYVLVDLWSHQDNYLDMYNEAHDTHYRTAMSKLKPHSPKITICRNLTTTCAGRFRDAFFDYVYVDARHDYTGVSADLEAWWPKIRHGGILGGHDYVEQSDGPQQTGQNWTLNFDGSVDHAGRAVKGAVDDFASRRRRQVVVMYRESGWNSWLIRK